MPFESVGPRVSPIPAKKDATIQLKLRAGAVHPLCMIGIRKALAERLELEDGEPVELMVGTGPEAGKIQIAFGSGVKVKTTTVRMARMGGARIDLGYVKQFPDTSKAKVEIDVTVLAVRKIEIALPDWEKVDAGRPRARKENNDPEPERVVQPRPNSSRPLTVAPLRSANGAVPRTPSLATKAADIPISREGVTISFDPPGLSYDGQCLALDDRQARFLAVLVRAMGGIMTTGDVLHKMGSSDTSGMIHELCFRKLVGPLGAIKLRLGHQKNFGYQLSRDR